MERILKTFMVRPDFPWEKTEAYQSYGTFRHADSGKWFALVMNVKKKVLDNPIVLCAFYNVRICCNTSLWNNKCSQLIW